MLLEGIDPSARVALLERVDAMTAAMKAAGLLTVEEHAHYERIRRSSYYFVKNGSTVVAPMRCKRCRVRHDYFTHMCIERPFAGLVGALQAYTQVRTDDGRMRSLLGRLGLKDLAELHPRTARLLLPEQPGADALSFAVGTLEPISRKTAEEYAEKIRGKDRRFRMEVV
jgi:hypothetical protein